MPDISMCRNEKCPVKTKCYRYMAMPNGWQSYANFEGGKKCSGFDRYRGNLKKRVRLIRDQLEKKGEKVITFEESVKASMGLRWRRVSKEDKKIVHEMSECQKKGGPIGSAIVDDEDTD